MDDSGAAMRVSEVMSSPVESIGPSATLGQAAARMTERGVGALVVEATSMGILTQGDIVAVVAEGVDPATVLVGERMTEPVTPVSPNRDLREAARLMGDLGVKHLPVVDDGVLGMVSSTDVVRHMPQYAPHDLDGGGA